MAKANKQAKSAAPYIQRLLEDKHVQEQLRNAVGGLRGAYTRATRKGGKAAEDKKLYANLRQSATSIRNAAAALQRPKAQPKRRAQKVAAAALAGGGALLVIKQQKAGAGGKKAQVGV
jgi:ferric-dicitrate binding protein FerR (iron transport regulator)